MGRFIRFQLERWLQRGAFHQLLLVSAVIIFVAVLGGLAAYLSTDDVFVNLFDAVWWSFLRLTDPGYLGDDEGTALRTISTIVTVLGYVLFLGSLIAIMTQWLTSTLERFEKGLSPISMQGHVVVLGWTSRTPEIVRQLLQARGRLERFLQRHDQRLLRIVVVAEEGDAQRRFRLRKYLGDAWRDRQVFLRSGSPTSSEALKRFGLPEAAAVVIPGDEFRFGGTGASDARVVKILLNLGVMLDVQATARGPAITAEVFDPRNEKVAKRVLHKGMEVVTGDAVVAQLLVQSIRDPRLVDVFTELLTYNDGCSPYIRAFPEFSGQHPNALNTRFDKAIVIGAIRMEEGEVVTYLSPPPDFRLCDGDRVVFIARSYADCLPSSEKRSWPKVMSKIDAEARAEPASLRLMVVGWSRRVLVLIEQLLESDFRSVDFTVVSRISIEKREATMQWQSLDPGRLNINHIEADFTAPGVIEGLEFDGVDSVLLLAGRGSTSAEESDARTIVSYGLLVSEFEKKFKSSAATPSIKAEMVHVTSTLQYPRSKDLLLIRPRVLGYLQSHVVLKRELNSVFSALFMPGHGAGISIHDIGTYQGQSGVNLSFAELQELATGRGEVALGLLIYKNDAGYEVELCPPYEMVCGENAYVIVLSPRFSLLPAIQSVTCDLL
jgi:hypothetical protein